MNLSYEEKKSIGLLQAGTILEYFDLMLYVHMSVILNEVFFPKSDPNTTAILSAVTFCSAYIFRPIGAMIFGYIGDHIGRKSTIILTTTMMAISCITIANLPTYAQIGITASWIFIICRILQGMSTMGELIGAQIYLTETIFSREKYACVSSLIIATSLGGIISLGIATLVTHYNLSWRICFLVGASIAIVGAFARTLLRETPTFLEMKRQKIKKGIHEMNLECDPEEGAHVNATWKEPCRPKTLISYFFIQCAFPLFFYIGYLYFTPILKNKFGYSANDIIKHNFCLSIISIINAISLVLLSYYFHPLKILRITFKIATIIILTAPFLIESCTSSLQIFFIQAMILAVPMGATPGERIFLSSFPFYKRCTFASLIFAFSHAIIYITTSFGLVFFTNTFSHLGIEFIALPICIFYAFGLKHFIKGEKILGYI